MASTAFKGADVIRLDIDISDIERRLGEMESQVTWTDEELRRIGNRARRIIQERTARGIDAFGKPFKPYSTRYAKLRKESGRRADVVNLLFQGDMRAAVQVVAEEGSALLAFTNANFAQRAFWHNEGTTRNGKTALPQRRWLDIDPNGVDTRDLTEMALEMILSRLNR